LISSGLCLFLKMFEFSTFLKCSWAICASGIVLTIAVMAAGKLLVMQEPTENPDLGIGVCMAANFWDYFFRRIAELALNGFLTAAATFLWVFIVCSSPFMSRGMCNGDDICVNTASTYVLLLSNIFAFIGRLRGGWLGKPNLTLLALETPVFCILGIIAVSMCVSGKFKVTSTEAVWVCSSVGCLLTLWSNSLLIRLSTEAQLSCGHDMRAPCPVSAQISWAAIQVGALVGALAAHMWA